MALVLVQLARGDVVAAEKAFKEWGTSLYLLTFFLFFQLFRHSLTDEVYFRGGLSFLLERQ